MQLFAAVRIELIVRVCRWRGVIAIELLENV